MVFEHVIKKDAIKLAKFVRVTNMVETTKMLTHGSYIKGLELL